MNWTLIKEKYPKIDKRLTKWVMSKGDMYSFNDRDLYDFFDEQGIRIAIYIDKEFYNYSLNDIEGYMFAIDDEGVSHSRAKAEEQAFLKAFEILEDKL